MHRRATLRLVAGCVILAGATHARAEEREDPPRDGPPRVVQVVALDECDPQTFNPAVGEEGTGFCHNVTLYGLNLGFETTLDELITEANNGTPDPGWDFEPDHVTIQKGTTISVVDQGGEPHTFTEVAHFGGGFVAGLNHGEATVPECDGGFKNVAVARTRILQGSHLDITGLSKGAHRFQCCIHPWMHMEVEVK
jgi:plastocyanin